LSLKRATSLFVLACSMSARVDSVQFGFDPKEEHTLEDWVGLIAREEAAGNEVLEASLREDFLHWERRSKSAPNGKWRGANSRKWGKVGIEMRLTGSVPRTQGPATRLGKMVCKFIDVVEVKRCHDVTDGAIPTDCLHSEAASTVFQPRSSPQVCLVSFGLL
jgi:hypothetical protein